MKMVDNMDVDCGSWNVFHIHGREFRIYGKAFHIHGRPPKTMSARAFFVF